ncbi:MAG: hypothetical protein K2O62_03805 [Clostridia bacterium]|nr:hypothetical protein [Clostridia bacterium]
MKATKKIVGAACALVAAVALSAGSTFAWFTSNGTVDAKGLEVAVSTNNAYLVIADTAANLSEGWKEISLAKVGKVADTSEDAEEGALIPVKLLPSSYKTVAADKTLSDDTTNDPEDSKCITDKANWYTAQGTTSTDGTIDMDTKTTLSTFTGYVIETNMYVSVAGTVAVKNVNMTISDETWSKVNAEATNNDPISVIILYRTLDWNSDKSGAKDTSTEWNRKELNAGNNHVFGESAESNFLKVNDGDLDATKYIEIHIMVYFDGHHKDVNTMNQINLTGVKLDFQFTDPSTSSGS